MYKPSAAWTAHIPIIYRSIMVRIEHHTTLCESRYDFVSQYGHVSIITMCIYHNMAGFQMTREETHV